MTKRYKEIVHLLTKKDILSASSLYNCSSEDEKLVYISSILKCDAYDFPFSLEPSLLYSIIPDEELYNMLLSLFPVVDCITSSNRTRLVEAMLERDYKIYAPILKYMSYYGLFNGLDCDKVSTIFKIADCIKATLDSPICKGYSRNTIFGEKPTVLTAFFNSDVEGFPYAYNDVVLSASNYTLDPVESFLFGIYSDSKCSFDGDQPLYNLGRGLASALARNYVVKADLENIDLDARFTLSFSYKSNNVLEDPTENTIVIHDANIMHLIASIRSKSVNLLPYVIYGVPEVQKLLAQGEYKPIDVAMRMNNVATSKCFAVLMDKVKGLPKDLMNHRHKVRSYRENLSNVSRSILHGS